MESGIGGDPNDFTAFRRDDSVEPPERRMLDEALDVVTTLWGGVSP